MPTRADLLSVAEGLAAAAKRHVGDGGSVAGAKVAAGLAGAAKTALEAAALAENTNAGEVDQALGSIQDLLEKAGVLAESMELTTTEFLQHTFQALIAWRAEVLSAQGFEVAYDITRELLEGLERDFLAGDTETSRRIAARIRMKLDDATAVVNHGKQGADVASDQA